MWNSTTLPRLALAAVLLASAGSVLADDLPAAAAQRTDAPHSSPPYAEPEAAPTAAPKPAEQPAIAEQDVKSMVEDEVRLQLSQRLAAFTPPS